MRCMQVLLRPQALRPTKLVRAFPTGDKASLGVVGESHLGERKPWLEKV